MPTHSKSKVKKVNLFMSIGPVVVVMSPPDLTKLKLFIPINFICFPVLYFIYQHHKILNPFYPNLNAHYRDRFCLKILGKLPLKDPLTFQAEAIMVRSA